MTSRNVECFLRPQPCSHGLCLGQTKMVATRANQRKTLAPALGIRLRHHSAHVSHYCALHTNTHISFLSKKIRETWTSIELSLQFRPVAFHTSIIPVYFGLVGFIAVPFGFPPVYPGPMFSNARKGGINCKRWLSQSHPSTVNLFSTMKILTS